MPLMCASTKPGTAMPPDPAGRTPTSTTAPSTILTSPATGAPSTSAARTPSCTKPPPSGLDQIVYGRSHLRSALGAPPRRAPIAVLALSEPPPLDAPGSSFPPIKEYAFLSDRHTGALVAPDGTIEWLCVPRFDAPSIFGSLLDRGAGGFRLGPYGVQVPGARRARTSSRRPG